MEVKGAQLLHSLDGTKHHPFVTPGPSRSLWSDLLVTSEFSEGVLRRPPLSQEGEGPGSGCFRLSSVGRS